jgi:hypothetical protein
MPANLRIHANLMTYHESHALLEITVPRLLSIVDHIVWQHNDKDQDIVDWAINTFGCNRILHIRKVQTQPPDYGDLRNNMLRYTPEGDWVLKWDADEIPSDQIIDNLRPWLADHPYLSGVMIPIWHLMKSSRTCLPMEINFAHLRLFRNINAQFHGAIHEQVYIPGQVMQVESRDMSVIHLSYFLERRLARKSAQYATIPSSGFTNPGDLVSRLKMVPYSVPSEVTYDLTDEEIHRLRTEVE